MKFPNDQLTDFNQAEISIHRVCQLLALTGVNLVPKKLDDSHTNLAWNTNRQTVEGRLFELNNNTLRLVYSPKEEILQFETTQEELVASIELSYSDHESLRMWWKMQLQELGFQGDLIDQVHYDMPETEAYSKVEIDATAAFVEAWMALRNQANEVFAHLNQTKKQASEIRIWPHHFDTGVYYELNEAGTKAIGAGMAIADTLQPEPYYYIYGWNKDGEIDFTNAPDLEVGKWLTGNWKGAVLPVSTLDDLVQTNQVNAFYSIAFDFLKASLV